MHVLTHDQVRASAPSVYATAPHPSVSRRYGFVPTAEVLEGLRAEGWYPIQAKQSQVRDPNRRAYARHLLRLRRIHDPIEVGECIAELVLTNSHDTSSAYALDIGLYRVQCTNGLVASLGKTGGIRVRHGCNLVAEVVGGSQALVRKIPAVAAALECFRRLPLQEAERIAYAKAALIARYGAGWGWKSPIRPARLIEARRAEDERTDLWTTYNVVQENMIKGGLKGRSGSGRTVRTRAIRSVSEDIRLNRALWRLTERFAARKTACGDALVERLEA